MMNSSRLKRASYDWRHAFRARPRAPPLGRHRDGRAGSDDLRRCGTRSVFRPILNKLGLDKLELVISRRCAAAGRDHGAVADVRRQRRRDVRPDRDRGRHHRRPARTVPASGRRRLRSGRLVGRSSPTMARFWCGALICSTYWNNEAAAAS